MDNKSLSDMPWFKFFGGTYFPFVKIASVECAGAVFKAVCCYVCEKQEDMPELTDSLSQALFEAIKKDIDESFEGYLKQVSGGKRGGRPPKNPPFATQTHPNPAQPSPTEEDVDEDGEGGDIKPPMAAPTHKRKRFVPPTVEEVAEYVRSRGSSVDPQGFVDFYTSKGWFVGKTPIKDWKAACRNAESWERWKNQPVPVTPPKPKRGRLTTDADGNEVVVFDD